MASFVRKTALYLGLVDDEDADYDEYDEPTESYRGQEQPARRGGAPTVVAARPEARRADPRPAPRVVRYEEPEPEPAYLDPYRITTITPRTYNEARTIGEHFREAVPVIINLTEMDDADAKRLVDFAAGLIFGLHGSIERITNKVFLLSPSNVDVSAEDKIRIAEGGFFNQS